MGRYTCIILIRLTEEMYWPSSCTSGTTANLQSSFVLSILESIDNLDTRTIVSSVPYRLNQGHRFFAGSNSGLWASGTVGVMQESSFDCSICHSLLIDPVVGKSNIKHTMASRLVIPRLIACLRLCMPCLFQNKKQLRGRSVILAVVARIPSNCISTSLLLLPSN